MSTDATYEWQQTQNDAYLQMCIDRLAQPPLRWVSQFVRLINEATVETGLSSVSVNDLGCCVGGFNRGIEELGTVEFDYTGYDISETYLSVAREHFPARCFQIADIATTRPREADVSVMSGTLEHLADWPQAIANIAATTRRFALIRTFLGTSHEWAYYYKEGARSPYPIMQFTFEEMHDVVSATGFSLEVIRDIATDSIPKYLGCGITRTQYVCRLTRNP